MYIKDSPDRRHTDSLKWDDRYNEEGKADVIPLWVADMDLASPDVVVEALSRRAAHPVYGYTNPPGDYRKLLAALDELRFVAGKDAVGYPQIQEHVWMCVCGRPNAKQSRRCCRCDRGLETVMASYQKTNVDQLIAIHEQKLLDIAKKAREDASKLAQEREKAIKLKERQAKRRLRRIVSETLSGGPSPPPATLCVSIRSMRSPGKMKPATELCMFTGTVTARMPGPSAAARKPRSPARMSEPCTTGWPAAMAVRTTEPASWFGSALPSM